MGHRGRHTFVIDKRQTPIHTARGDNSAASVQDRMRTFGVYSRMAKRGEWSSIPVRER